MIASIRIERTLVKRQLASIGRAALVVGMVAGCSSVPDAINPVSWYDGVADLVSSPETPELAVPRTAQGQPATTDSAAAAKPAIPEGLGADHGHANYAGAVHRDVAPTKPLVRRPAAAPEPAVAEAPVPAARPIPGAVAAAPAIPTEVAAQARQAGARGDLGPQSPPSERPNMTPPARPDIPDQVTLTPPRGRHALDEQYQRRLAESAAASVGSSEAMGSSGLGGGGYEPIHLIPPGGRGKGLAAPLPAGPSASFQVAALDFGGGSTALSAEDRQSITQVAKLYRQTGGVIRIIGLPTRASASNGAVEIARANAVALELTRQGIPAGKLFVAADPSEAAGDNAGAHVFLDY